MKTSSEPWICLKLLSPWVSWVNWCEFHWIPMSHRRSIQSSRLDLPHLLMIKPKFGRQHSWSSSASWMGLLRTASHVQEGLWNLVVSGEARITALAQPFPLFLLLASVCIYGRLWYHTLILNAGFKVKYLKHETNPQNKDPWNPKH